MNVTNMRRFIHELRTTSVRQHHGGAYSGVDMSYCAITMGWKMANSEWCGDYVDGMGKYLGIPGGSRHRFPDVPDEERSIWRIIQMNDCERLTFAEIADRLEGWLPAPAVTLIEREEEVCV
jgi:hypothetical protein